MPSLNALALDTHLPMPPPRVVPPGGFAQRAPRARTCLNGRIVYGEGAYSVDCAIRDMSEGGARVTISERQFLPVGLYLIVVRNCVAHEAKVVWLKYPARGLQFLHTYALSDALPRDLQYLRKLWGNLYARGGWDMKVPARRGWDDADILV
jgi:hypothetical protein